jgi:5-methyltetrahydropteroyltriglutamate--homocysteine methyltransferase
MTLPPFATQIVGSWSKPRWLADHDLVYGEEGTWWRVPVSELPEAQDDAVRLAVADQQRAGLTVLGDGEQRRQTFSGHFYALGGIDNGERGAPTHTSSDVIEFLTMKQRPTPPPAPEGEAPKPPAFLQPRVVGPITWERPIVADDVRFLRRLTDGPTKVTIIGPSTLALRLVDEHYGSLQDLAFGIADALNHEVLAAVDAGATLVQLDEPEVHFRYSYLRDFAAEAIDRALHGVPEHVSTAVHVCYGYSKNIAEKRATPVYPQALEVLAGSAAQWVSLEYEQPQQQPELLEHLHGTGAILGLLNLDTEAPVETVDHVLDRARAAVEVVGPDKLSLAPDCGMWFLPRETATAKAAALEGAARVLRAEHAR